MRDRILTARIPPQVIIAITFIHVLPLVLNEVFKFASFSAMLAYALVLSPLITFAIVNRLFRTAGG